MAVLDAERAGAGTGGQMAEHSKGQGPGKLVQFLIRQALQAAGKEIGPANVLGAGCSNSILCRLQSGWVYRLCGGLKLSGAIGHIRFSSHLIFNKRMVGSK